MSDTRYRVGIIGTGRPRNTPDFTGFGMSHAHAKGYNATGKCEIVGLADIVPERANLFNDEHAGGKATVYTDYQKMLEEVKPDIVSICTWPDLHAPMVIAAAEAGVRAIHCEKPMAPTWGDSKKMAEVCQERGVQLSFNHQRRFLPVFQTARRLAKEGAIGQLTRLEGSCSNMMDWGTHWLNMFLFYNDDTPGKWVLGQIDIREPRLVYGVPNDTQAICSVCFQNDVEGLLFTGMDSDRIVGCSNRLVGTEGSIEVLNKEPFLRVLRHDGKASDYAPEGGLHGGDAITDTIKNVVECVDTGAKPLVDVSNALATTEIIYATYLSSLQRGRVDLPLDYEGNALAEMLESGVFPNGLSSETSRIGA